MDKLDTEKRLSPTSVSDTCPTSDLKYLQRAKPWRNPFAIAQSSSSKKSQFWFRFLAALCRESSISQISVHFGTLEIFKTLECAESEQLRRSQPTAVAHMLCARARTIEKVDESGILSMAKRFSILLSILLQVQTSFETVQTLPMADYLVERHALHQQFADWLLVMLRVSFRSCAKIRELAISIYWLSIAFLCSLSQTCSQYTIWHGRWLSTDGNLCKYTYISIFTILHKY